MPDKAKPADTPEAPERSARGLSLSGRQSATKTAKQPHLIPQPNGRGALLSGGKPGNKGGGRVKEKVYERAAEILTDDTVWDVQLARAKSGDGHVIDRALEIHGLTKGNDLNISGELTIKVEYDD